MSDIHATAEQPFVPAEVIMNGTKWPCSQWYTENLFHEYLDSFEASLLSTWQIHVDKLLDAADQLCYRLQPSLDDTPAEQSLHNALDGIIQALKRKSADLTEISELINHLILKRGGPDVIPEPQPGEECRELTQ